MVFQPLPKVVLIKVGSVSCDPDCPFFLHLCCVYPKNSVRNWSCEFEVGFV